MGTFLPRLDVVKWNAYWLSDVECIFFMFSSGNLWTVTHLVGLPGDCVTLTRCH
jgi:hypothetical protein